MNADTVDTVPAYYRKHSPTKGRMKTQSQHIADLIALNEKRDLLQPAEPEKPTAREVVEAIACLGIFMLCMWLIMIVGSAAGFVPGV